MPASSNCQKIFRQKQFSLGKCSIVEMETGCENLPFLTRFGFEKAKQSQGNNLSFYLEERELFKMEGVFRDKQGTIPLREREERAQIKPKCSSSPLKFCLTWS